MSTPDPRREILLLEEKLEEALAKFQRMPGAMWLATSAIIESAGRLVGVPLDAALAQRQAEMLVRARKARDDAGPRSSEHDVSAITAWLELAQKRAPLETRVTEALKAIAEHRRADPALGAAPSSRLALEKAMAMREQDVVERERRLQIGLPANAAAIVQRVRAESPEIDPSHLGDVELATRGAAASARLAAARMAKRWSYAPFPSATLLTGLAFASAGAILFAAYRVGVATSDRELVALVAAAAAATGLGLLAWAYARRGWERANHEAMSDFLGARERDEARLSGARRDLELIMQAAKALGALDAFGATEDGRTLEARESRLVALAPWIRETVGGFNGDQIRDFAP